MWFVVMRFGSFGVHLEFCLCEKKTNHKKKLQVYQVINCFGPQEMVYRCNNTIKQLCSKNTE